jgi:hypothetical protein
VQRSGNNNGFVTIGKIKAAGNSSSNKNYVFNDVLTSNDDLNVYNYRLKSVDNNGSFSYSSVVALHPDNHIYVKVYPNPAHNFVNIEGNSLKQVQLFDRTGKILATKTIANSITQLNIQSLASGVYTVRMIDNKGNIHIRQIVVN